MKVAVKTVKYNRKYHFKKIILLFFFVVVVVGFFFGGGGGVSIVVFYIIYTWLPRAASEKSTALAWDILVYSLKTGVGGLKLNSDT